MLINRPHACKSDSSGNGKRMPFIHHSLSASCCVGKKAFLVLEELMAEFVNNGELGSKYTWQRVLEEYRRGREAEMASGP